MTLQDNSYDNVNVLSNLPKVCLFFLNYRSQTVGDASPIILSKTLNPEMNKHTDLHGGRHIGKTGLAEELRKE